MPQPRGGNGNHACRESATSASVEETTMATASRELRSIAGKPPSSDIIREAFHESLRDYVRTVLEQGQQSAESESLVRSAFAAILRSGSVDDIEWVESRLGRAISALDDGHYMTVHAHQTNFKMMIQALGMQKSIRGSMDRVWAS